jgi:hypothetical protein
MECLRRGGFCGAEKMSTAPLSLKEIDDYLVKKANGACPFCGGKKWGLHTNEGRPDLRSLPRITITKKDDGDDLSGSVALGTKDALVLAMAECLDCGHAYGFNYFSLMRKIRDGDDTHAEH